MVQRSILTRPAYIVAHCCVISLFSLSHTASYITLHLYFSFMTVQRMSRIYMHSFSHTLKGCLSVQILIINHKICGKRKYSHFNEFWTKTKNNVPFQTSFTLITVTFAVLSFFSLITIPIYNILNRTNKITSDIYETDC